MRRHLLRWLRRVLGTQQVLDELRGLQAAGGGTIARGSDAPGGLTLLPGTPYARLAIPLDYPPSRDFRPRYGHDRPPLPALVTWFDRHVDAYAAFLEYMRSLPLSTIPIRVEDAPPGSPAWVGGPIAAFDSLALYAMVTRRRPRTYLEIGSGMTTCFARRAVSDAGLATRIISIDPEPRREVDAICDEVVRQGLEVCDVSVFDRLEPGDILFFDGSHRSFMNSDVTVFFLDVLPRIKPGVIVHLHDIMLPWDYPASFRDWYWNEQYMLAVFLQCAMDRIDPLLPTAFVCRCERLQPHFARPFIDLGSPERNAAWRGGGSMWFTMTSRLPGDGGSVTQGVAR